MDNIHDKNLLDIIKKNEHKKRSRNYIVIGVVLVAAVAFILFTTRNVTETEQQTKILASTKDSLETANKVLTANKNREKIVREKVDQYFKRQSFSPENLRALFTDTLKRYYVQLNVPIESAIKEDTKYWQKNPDEKLYFDSSSVAINFTDTAGIQGLIKAIHCRQKNKCREVLQEIRFNDDYKIYYVRAFTPEN